MTDLLVNIEAEFDVDSFVTEKDGTNVWPFLKHRLVYDHLSKTVEFSSKKRTRNKRLLLKNFVYGFKNLFGIFNYEFYCFQNTNRRTWYNEKWFDIYFDSWADKLGQDKSLFVEFASENYHPKAKVHSKNIVSDLPMKLMAWGFEKFASPKLKNKDLLNELKDYTKSGFNFEKETKKQLGHYYFYRWFFKRCKNVKTVFIISSGSKVPLIAAAKSLGIPVVEAQHGYIGKGHPFYTTTHPTKGFYPDALLSFGTYEKQSVKNNIFEPDQILPTGSLQLQLEKNKEIPEPLQQLRKKHKYIVCLTMQNWNEKELLGITHSLAVSETDVLFIICPKDRSLDYTSYTSQPKYKLSEYSVYDILKISDINLTLFSTTAVEGEFLGATTVFYNIGGYSRTYFNISAMGSSVIEETEVLTLEHLTQSQKSKIPYFIDHYFKNVDQLNLEKVINEQ